MAKKIRKSGNARVRLSITVTGKTNTEVVSLKHGKLNQSPSASAAETASFKYQTYWRAGSLGGQAWRGYEWWYAYLPRYQTWMGAAVQFDCYPYNTFTQCDYTGIFYAYIWDRVSKWHGAYGPFTHAGWPVVLNY